MSRLRSWAGQGLGGTPEPLSTLVLPVPPTGRILLEARATGTVVPWGQSRTEKGGEANAKEVGKRPMQGPWDGSPHLLEPALQQTGLPSGQQRPDRPSLPCPPLRSLRAPHYHPPPLRQPPAPTTPVREAPHLPQGRLPQTPNNGQSEPGARRAETQAQGLRPKRSQRDSAPHLQGHHRQPAWDPGPDSSG